MTDAKGKLQYRVTLIERNDGALWIECPADQADGLEDRLTRYLIADDVEVADLTGRFMLWHFLGSGRAMRPDIHVRQSSRYGCQGEDWWIPVESEIPWPDTVVQLTADEFETMRISNGIPSWGHELSKGMLPPEALLDATDISYNKGCYVGQEVISRIKSAGKVNRYLTRFEFDGSAAVFLGPLENGVGEITSISPMIHNSVRQALGYIKRGAKDWVYKTGDGLLIDVRPTSINAGT